MDGQCIMKHKELSDGLNDFALQNVQTRKNTTMLTWMSAFLASLKDKDAEISWQEFEGYFTQAVNKYRENHNSKELPIEIRKLLSNPDAYTTFDVLFSNIRQRDKSDIFFIFYNSQFAQEQDCHIDEFITYEEAKAKVIKIMQGYNSWTNTLLGYRNHLKRAGYLEEEIKKSQSTKEMDDILQIQEKLFQGIENEDAHPEQDPRFTKLEHLHNKTNGAFVATIIEARKGIRK